MFFEEDLDLSTVLGKRGLLKEFMKAILERALAAEIEDHLGYQKVRMPGMEVTQSP